MYKDIRSKGPFQKSLLLPLKSRHTFWATLVLVLQWFKASHMVPNSSSATQHSESPASKGPTASTNCYRGNHVCPGLFFPPECRFNVLQREPRRKCLSQRPLAAMSACIRKDRASLPILAPSTLNPQPPQPSTLDASASVT